jgi:hypothetical protein
VPEDPSTLTIEHREQGPDMSMRTGSEGEGEGEGEGKCASFEEPSLTLLLKLALVNGSSTVMRFHLSSWCGIPVPPMTSKLGLKFSTLMVKLSSPPFSAWEAIIN